MRLLHRMRCYGRFTKESEDNSRLAHQTQSISLPNLQVSAISGLTVRAFEDRARVELIRFIYLPSNYRRGPETMYRNAFIAFTSSPVVGFQGLTSS